MGASNFDDVLERLLLLQQSIVELLESGQEAFANFSHGGYMHSGWESVQVSCYYVESELAGWKHCARVV
jgi:hypothetical protein